MRSRDGRRARRRRASVRSRSRSRPSTRTRSRSRPSTRTRSRSRPSTRTRSTSQRRSRLRFHRDAGHRGDSSRSSGRGPAVVLGAVLWSLVAVAALAAVPGANGWLRGRSLALAGLLAAGAVWLSVVVVAHFGAVLAGRLAGTVR